jgi:hypothetical protein
MCNFTLNECWHILHQTSIKRCVYKLSQCTCVTLQTALNVSLHQNKCQQGIFLLYNKKVLFVHWGGVQLHCNSVILHSNGVVLQFTPNQCTYTLFWCWHNTSRFTVNEVSCPRYSVLHIYKRQIKRLETFQNIFETIEVA